DRSLAGHLPSARIRKPHELRLAPRITFSHSARSTSHTRRHAGFRSPKTADALILRTSGGESLFARGAFELKSWLFVVRFSTIWLPSCRIESRDLNSEVLEESGLVVQRGA